MKQCTKCGLFKDEEDFFKDKQKVSSYRPDCKSCNKAKSLKWAQENPEKRKYIMLKFETGLSKEQYEKLLELQNNKCAICNTDKGKLSKSLSVDHCHESKLVRGLLCAKCNMGLGYFNDNEELLLKALDYLRENLSSLNISFKEKKNEF